MSINVIKWKDLQDKPLKDSEQPRIFDKLSDYKKSPFYRRVVKEIQRKVGKYSKHSITLPKARFESPNGNMLTFQGMIHVAPEEFYQWCISEHQEQKGHILYEGIDLDKAELLKIDPNLHENLGRIRTRIAEITNSVRQTKELLQYPETAIRADMDSQEFMSEITELQNPLLEEKNYMQRVLLRWLLLHGENLFKYLFFKFLGGKDPSTVLRELSFQFFKDGLPILNTKTEEGLNLKLKKAYEEQRKEIEYLILIQRNQILSSKIIELDNQNAQDIYVQYGAAHLQGLTKLLIEEGWKLREVDLINIEYKTERPYFISIIPKLIKFILHIHKANKKAIKKTFLKEVRKLCANFKKT